MNNKLGFITYWVDINNKGTTWSGTNLSLLKSLQKYYTVEEKTVNKYYIGLLGKKLRSFFVNYCTLNEKRIYEKICLKKEARKLKNIPTILFNDYPIYDDVPSYIYQDLCCDYLFKTLQNDLDLFEVSGFAHMNRKGIVNQSKQQHIAYPKAAGIFCMGKWLQKYIIENYDVDPSKVHHVGGGSNIDLSKINPKIKNNHRILFVGRDFKRKNGYLVVEAFKTLKERYDNEAELFVAGPTDNPINENIDGYKFLGELSTDELSNYFNKCDIFVMPSKFEAYGLVFVEALCYGLPCIGYNRFEMPYFIEKGITGDLIDDENPDILAEKMFNLLNNEQIKQNVISKREWYSKEYNWDTVASRIKTIIENDKEQDNL